MRNRLNSKSCAALIGVLVLAALPEKVLAAPIRATSPSNIRATAAPVDKIHYRRYYGGYARRGYYYNPSGAIAAGAALGLMGAGMAAASGSYYGYPGYYGYPAYGYPAYGYPPYGGYYGW